MTESAELESRGFALLLERPQGEEFFEGLQAKGLFDPARNPAAIVVPGTGTVRVPFWAPLPYLERLAARADEELAERIMNVIRAVNAFREPDGKPRHNYHTARVFATIYGLLPVSTVTLRDLDVVPVWLSDRVDNGGTVKPLADVIARFLDEGSTSSLEKAVALLRHCTALQWIKKFDSDEEASPATVADGFWLAALAARHATKYGQTAGFESATILSRRLREAFERGPRRQASWLYRPTIETHEQNHPWYRTENNLVEMLREVMLAWCGREPAAAKAFVTAALADEAEIVRRVAIHVVDERWDLFRGDFASFVGPALFREGHLHELYRLLERHFAGLGSETQAQILQVIRDLSATDSSAEAAWILSHVQWGWLSAIVGKGSGVADQWHQALETKDEPGTLSEHPDFHTYHSTHVGSGPSPHTVEDLLAFAKEGTLIERLKSFVPSDGWWMPSVGGLMQALESAVYSAPGMFVGLTAAFRYVAPPYQHGFISALSRLWREGEEKRSSALHWDQLWEELIGLFEVLVEAPASGESTGPTSPSPSEESIRALIAEVLRAGTMKDERAYPDVLLPRAWALIGRLLAKTRPAVAGGRDPMFEAINSGRGKAIEALFSHALRACRLQDAVDGQHTVVWAGMVGRFDEELARCRNANFEFSTLAGSYIAHALFLDGQWVERNLAALFPRSYAENFRCAIDGLAYSPASATVYKMLRAAGVIEGALEVASKGSVRESLVERVGLAYIWGIEELEGMGKLFTCAADDLGRLADFFSSFRADEIEPPQVQRIIDFGVRSLEWSGQCSEHGQLVSRLSGLTRYLSKLDETETNLLIAVAPHAHSHRVDSYIEELVRLVEVSPAAVSRALGRLIDDEPPDHDFQGHLAKLVLTLAEKGLRPEAIAHAERLRSLPGILEVYKALLPGGAHSVLGDSTTPTA